MTQATLLKRPSVSALCSPLCGSGRIYDGTFAGRTNVGFGVARVKLLRSGFSVFKETEIDIMQHRLLD